MRNGILLLAGAALLAGCGGGGVGGMEVPGFLGREGNAAGFYNPRGEPAPDAQALPLGQAVAERGPYGVIVRVAGVAPAGGFWGAELTPLGEGPDANGVLAFRFVAFPPAEPAFAGAPQTRTLTAGAFVPNITARKARSLRIEGANGVQTLPMPAIPKA